MSSQILAEKQIYICMYKLWNFLIRSDLYIR